MFLFALSLLASTGSPTTELFRESHLGDPVKLATASDANGSVVSVIGRFDVGLDGASSGDPFRVADAVANFVSQFAPAFGGDDMYALALVHSETARINDKIRVMRFMQTYGGVAVFGGELSITLFEDGKLHSVNGAIARASTYAGFVPEPQDPSVALLMIENALVHLSDRDLAASGVDTVTDGDIVLGAEGRTQFVGTMQSVVVERHLAIDDSSTFWTVETPGAVVELSEQADVIRATQKRRHVNGSCDVTHQDYLRFSSGVIMAFRPDGKSGSMSTRVSCDADSVFGSCNWHLKRQEGISHPIPRIDDANSFTEMEINGACSGFIPNFNSTATDDIEEQTAFFATHRARAQMIANAFGPVTVNQSDPLEVHVDDASAGAGSAFFDTILREIHISSELSRDIDVMWHEYGHYVQWAYGDTSFNCTSTDHGAATGETVANSFAYVIALGEFQLLYGSVAGMGNGQAPSAHTNSASRLVNPGGNCDVNADPPDPAEIHIFGRAFEQAIWELLFNKNCNSDSCTSNTTFGSTIWTGSASASTVRLRVGTALAHAQSVLGTSQNFFQISLHMEDRIGDDVDSATQTRAANVFAHHGY